MAWELNLANPLWRFLFFGQSNSNGVNGPYPQSTPVVEAADANTQLWDDAAGNYRTVTNSYGYRTFANRATTLLNGPIAIGHTYQDASAIFAFTDTPEGLANGNAYGRAGVPGDGFGLADYVSAGIEPNALNMGGCDGLLTNQGENDASIPPTLRRTYMHYLLDGIQRPLCEALGHGSDLSKVPIYVASNGKITDTNAQVGAYGHSMLAWYMLKTHHDIGRRLEHCYFSHSMVDAETTDTVHWVGDPTHINNGGRFAQFIAYQKGYTSDPPWFEIASIAIADATTTTVNLTHYLGTDFTPTSDIAHFEVSENGVDWITSTGARTDADTITLTHASLSTGRRWLRYLYAHDTANTDGIVQDNSDYTVALHPTMEPIVVNPGNSHPVFQWYYTGAVYPNTPTSTSLARFAFIEVDNDAGGVVAGIITGLISANLQSVTLIPVDIDGNVIGSPIVASTGNGGVVGQTTGGSPKVAGFQLTVPAGGWLYRVDLQWSGDLSNNPYISLWKIAGPAPATWSFTADRQLAQTSLAVDVDTASGGFMLVGAQQSESDGIAVTGDESFAQRGEVVHQANSITHYTFECCFTAENATNTVIATPPDSADIAIGVLYGHS